jgi:hypothetical protein
LQIDDDEIAFPPRDRRAQLGGFCEEGAKARRQHPALILIAPDQDHLPVSASGAGDKSTA